MDKIRNLSEILDTSEVTGLETVLCHLLVSFTGCNSFCLFFSVQGQYLCRDTLLLVVPVYVGG